MAEKTMIGFDVLVELAGKYVEIQKGVWDHTTWLDFLTDVQKKGFELSSDMKTYLGSVMEAMKKFYEVITTTKGMENAMLEISRHTVDFIKYTQGIWTPSGLDAFLKDIQKRGFDLTEETKSYLSEILESVSKLYTTLPPMVSKEETKATHKKDVKEAKTTK